MISAPLPSFFLSLASQAATLHHGESDQRVRHVMSLQSPQYKPTKHRPLLPSHSILYNALPTVLRLRCRCHRQLASLPPPSQHAGASPSAPHTSTCTAAVSPFRSTLCRKSPKMCSMSLSPAWTRASRWVRITLLPRHKDGTVLFLHLFVKKNSHRIKMANLLVPPAKYHSAALASSPPVNISSYSLSRTRACLLTS